MNKITIVISISLLCLLFSCGKANKQALTELRPEPIDANTFYEQTMRPKPFLPKNQSGRSISCKLPSASNNTHLTSEDANYQDYGWEKRIAKDWSFFNIPENDGRILIIDIKQQAGKPAYRYLANNTHTQIYEPWSSSKIFAYTGAMAQFREKAEISDDIAISEGVIGEHHIADMITSINSYDSFGKADGNSNALATFFANLATRDYLSGLFYDEWLKLSTPNISFRGAYGPTAFEPASLVWQPTIDSTNNEGELKITIDMNNVASKDPGYLPYRCDSCGLTGNKPMTTLAQAEWLKRLAMHNLDTSTAHPKLTQNDVDTLFYGIGHSQNKAEMAGMTLGISTMLQQAIAKHIDPNSTTPESAKITLDNTTQGNWRVFQKIGWGPSETRSTSENVVLAYVCLPEYDGGRAFVIAAQVAVPEAKEENVALAGLKMQKLLDEAIFQYLQKH